MRLAETSTHSIDLLAYGGTFLHDALPNFAEVIARRAAAGVAVRLLFGDPSSDAVRLRGSEEGIGQALAARCHLTWTYFAPLLELPGVDGRKHGATVYHSIFRFDDTLLANAHVYGAPASQNPVVEVRQIPGGRTFRHYMTGFERTWKFAEPIIE